MPHTPGEGEVSAATRIAQDLLTEIRAVDAAKVASDQLLGFRKRADAAVERDFAALLHPARTGRGRYYVVNYSVKQVTTYSYASSVPFARHLLRLTPVSGPEQTVLSSSIAVDPQPRERHEAEDFFGNHVTQIAFEAPHETMTITCEAQIDVAGGVALDPAATPAWREIRDAATQVANLSSRSPVHYIYPSRLVPIDLTIRDLRRAKLRAGTADPRGGARPGGADQSRLRL